MSYTNLSIQKKEKSLIEITFEVSAQETDTYYKQALQNLGKDIAIPGFRKGHVPERVLVERLSEQAILEEAAKLALEREYPNIVASEKLSVIGKPKAEITKLARGNPFGFRIESATIPSVVLPPYKTIAQQIMGKPVDVTVTDGEIDNLITDIRRNKWHIEHKEEAEKGVPPKEEELPPLTDEMVHQLGDFADVTDFKTKAHEGLRREKELRIKDARRAELGEKLVNESSIELPDVLVEGELDNMKAQFKHNLSHAKTTLEDYLKRVNKSEAELRDEWREQAQKRARLQLILSEIAQKEHVRADQNTVDQEVSHILKHHKLVNKQHARSYVSMTLTNDAVFKYLEQAHDNT